jgi:hypothetical protein
MADVKPLKIRMPAELRAKLDAAAARRRVSLNREINDRLARSFAVEKSAATLEKRVSHLEQLIKKQ